MDSRILIDTEDLGKVSKYPWHITHFGYVAHTNPRGSKPRQLWLHRFIMHPKKGEIVDHINRNKLDNRKENLRIATKGQNAINSKLPSNNTSGFKGVSRNNQGKRYWAAYIKIDQKHKFLGNYITKESAAMAYAIAAKRFFGEFASLNFAKGDL